MPRLSLGLGLNLPRPIFLGGGGIPTEPTGFVAKYTAYNVANFSLDVGSEVTQWNDESVNGNDLSSTGTNRPILIQNANTYLNRVVFDGADDFLDGLPPQAGDFTYIINYTEDNIQASTGALLSNDVDDGVLASFFGETYDLVSSNTQESNIFSVSGTEPNRVMAIVRNGDNLDIYKDSLGSTNNTEDVTGQLFYITRLGDDSSVANMQVSEVGVWDRALTQEEINYYSYLRSGTGEILLPPLLPS